MLCEITYLRDFLLLRLARLARVWGSSECPSPPVDGCPSWLSEPAREPGPSPAATSIKQLKNDAFCTTHPISRIHPNTLTCACSCHTESKRIGLKGH